MVLNKRIPRDLKKNFVRWFSIFLLTVVGMYMVISLMSSAETVIQNQKIYNETNKLEDGQFSTFVALSDKDIDTLEKTGVTIEQSFYLDYFQNDNSTVRVFKNREEINIIFPTEGKLASTDNEVLVERLYAEKHNLKIGDSINLGNKTFEICGIGVTPDYDNVLQNVSDIQADGNKFGTMFVSENAFKQLEKLDESSYAETYLYSYIINNENTTALDLRNAICDLDFDYTTVDDVYFREMLDEIQKDKIDLEKNIDDLAEASNKMLDSTKEFKDSSKALYDAIDTFDNEFVKFSDSIEDLYKGVNSLNNNSDEIIKGANSIFDVFLSQAEEELKSYGIQVDLTKDNYQKELNKISNNLSEISSVSEFNSMINSLNQVNEFYKGVCSYTQGVVSTQQAISQINSGTSQLLDLSGQAVQNSSQIVSSNPTEENLQSLLQCNVALNTGIGNIHTNVNDINNALITLTSNNETLVNGASTIFSELLSMTENELASYGFKEILNEDNYAYTLDSISKSLPSVIEENADKSIDELINSINSYKTFYNGLIAYTNGVEQTLNGVKSLNDATDVILDANKEMSNSVEELVDYSGDLVDGASELNENVINFQEDSDEVLDTYFSLEIDNLVEFTKASDNPRIGNSTIAVETRKAQGLLCGVVVIILIGYIISVFIVHNIDKESATIGALYSMGFNKIKLMKHYITMPALLTFTGGLLGTLIGYSPIGCGIQLAETINANSTPTFTPVYDIGIILYGVVLPPVIATIVSILIINKKLSIQPIKLLKHEKNQSTGVKIDLDKIGFINSFRIRRLMNEVKTSIAVFVGMFIPLMLIILAVDCFVGIDKLDNDIKNDASYNYLYSMKYPTAEIPDDAEEIYMESLKMSAWGADLDVSIMGINKDNPYFEFEMDGEKNTVYVGSGAANKFGVKKGDTIILNSSVDNRYYSFEVSDIVQYSIGFHIFMDIDDMRDIFGQSDDYYNALLSLEKLDIESERVYSIIEKKDLLSIAPNIRKSMSSITYMMISGSIAVYIVVMYLMIKLMIDRAAQNISLMKIFGYNKKEIRKLYLDSNFITILISAIISVPLAKIIIDELWFKMMIAEMSTSMITSFEPYIYICLYASIFILYFVVNFMLRRNLDKVSPNEVLKNRE